MSSSASFREQCKTRGAYKSEGLLRHPPMRGTTDRLTQLAMPASRVCVRDYYCLSTTTQRWAMEQRILCFIIHAEVTTIISQPASQPVNHANSRRQDLTCTIMSLLGWDDGATQYNDGGSTFMRDMHQQQQHQNAMGYKTKGEDCGLESRLGSVWSRGNVE